MFSFAPELAPPQIQYIRDVLYIMRCVDQPLYFIMAKRDSPTYIANLGLVLAAGAEEFIKIRVNGQESLETALAKLILLMCPNEACCLYVDAYVEASVRSGTLTIKANNLTPMERRELCGCPRCNEPLREL